MNLTRLVPVVILSLFVCGVSEAGTVLFSDIGSSPTQAWSSGGYSVSGATSGNGAEIWWAASFTVSGTGNFSVTEADFALSYLANPSVTLASVWSDVGGAPGADIGPVWSLTPTTEFSDCCTPVSQTGITGLTLTGGTTDFMVMKPQVSDSNAWNLWYVNNQGDYDAMYYSDNEGPWMPNPNFGTQIVAFDLTGNAISSGAPEPSTISLLGTGAALLGLLRFRGKRQLT